MNFSKRVFKHVFPRREVPTSVDMAWLDKNTQTGDEKDSFDTFVERFPVGMCLPHIKAALSNAYQCRLTLAYPERI